MVLTGPYFTQRAWVSIRMNAMLAKIGEERFGLAGTDDQKLT